jgi:uncharacterized membrane protein
VNFRQIFSFIKTKLKFKDKQYVGLYSSVVSTPRVRSIIRLTDGSVVVFGWFSGYIDSNGINYSSRNILKLLPTGEVDTSFLSNIGSGFDQETIGATTDGTNLYVVGVFNSFNGITNNARYIAKLSTSGVFDTAFSNNLDVVPGTKASTSGFNLYTYTITTDGTNLYVGGDFSSFKNVTNNARYIAKLSTSGVFDTAFSNNLDVVSGTKTSSSSFNSAVNTILVDGGNLYIGGSFTSFKGVTDNAKGIAKLSTSGVFDTAFSDNLDITPGTKLSTSGVLTGNVATIQTDGTNLYIGGDFTSFKPTVTTVNNARGIAKLSMSGVFDTAFSNNLDVVSGTKDTTSGFNTGVSVIAIDGTSLYVAGSFTSFKGIADNARRIAKLSISGVFDTAFSDNLDIVPGTKASTSGFLEQNTSILAMTMDSNSLYIGGSLISFKNNPLIGIAKLSKLGTFESNFSNSYSFKNSINTVVTDNEGNRYIGGGFLYYNGTYIGGLAKILPNGDLDPVFSSNIGSGISGQVSKIILDGNNLYVAGNFSSFNGITNNARRIAKLSTSGVFDTAFSNNLDVVPGTKADTSGFNNEINDMVKIGTDLYVAGWFTSFKNVANNARYIAKLSTSGVFDTAFSNNLDVVSGTKASTSGFNNTSWSVGTDGINLYVGGQFTSFKNVTDNARGIAKLSTSGVFDTAFSDNLDVVSGTKASTSGFSIAQLGIATIVSDGSSIYVGGDIISFKNVTNNSRCIAKLSTSGVFDTAFSNNLDAISGTKATTSGFNDGANIGRIVSMTIRNSDLYIGGFFTNFKGTFNNARYIAKLSTSGVFDTSFSNYLDRITGSKTTFSGFDYAVYDVTYDYNYNSLVIAGAFTKFKSEPAISLYAININT